jgi:hypothetical protein
VNPSRHIASLAFWFALAVVASPAIAAPIDVLPGTPEVACPDRVAVQEALFAQVGSAAPAPGWRLSYRSSDDVAGAGALRLLLADDRGRSRLRRQLRVEGDDCHARAEAIALIVYRFFAELGATDVEPVAPSPPPAVPFARVSPTTTQRPARLRLSFEAGGGLWTRRPGTGTTVLGVRVARANVEAAVSVLAPRAPAVERHADGGEVEVTALGVAIGLGVVRQGARLRLHGGPMAIVSRESARSRGIAVPGENAGATAALGLAAGASSRLWQGLHLGVDAGLGHAVFGNRFVVGGWGRVLPPPPWQGVVVARLGYAFSP